jgi:hypothetical protein
MVRGSNPLWASFYDSGRTRLGDDGAEESDPDHSPHFRVSCQLLRRMLHTFKKGYVDEDEKRKTSVLLSQHVQRKTERLNENVSKAAERLQRRKVLVSRAARYTKGWKRDGNQSVREEKRGKIFFQRFFLHL